MRTWRLVLAGLILAALTSVLASQTPPTQSGILATGSVTLSGPRGPLTGTIELAAWGEDHCRITIQLGPAAFRREYTAVLNGKRRLVTGPAGLLNRAPLPLGGAIGCGLAPATLALDRMAAGDGATVTADAAGRPRQLQWTEAGQPITVTYSAYEASPGAGLAGTVSESVDGETRLQITFASVRAQAFSEADFPLPALPARAARKGGAQ